MRAAVAASAVLMLATGLGSPASAEAPGGVVVARVAPGSAAERNGLRPGDRLLRWQQGDAGGTFDSPFDVLEVELERAPRGEVHLSGLRESVPLAVALFPDHWGLEVRPPLPDEVLAIYEGARRDLTGEDAEAALADLLGLAEHASVSAALEARLWVAWETVRAGIDAGRLEGARAAALRGAREAREHDRREIEAQFLTELARALEEWGRLDEALSLLTEALAIRRALAPQGLAVATTLTRRSRVALAQVRDQGQARADLAQATAAFESLAPRSLAQAVVLEVLAFSLPTTSDCVQTLERALALKETLAPESLAVADALYRLTDLTYDVQRRLERAQHTQAIRHRLAPGSLEEAASLSILADAERRLGDTRAAEQHERQALAMRERLRPGSLQVAESLRSLGNLLLARGDLAGAEAADLRAIEICETTAPESELLSRLRNNMGYLARLQGDFAAAEAHLNRALSTGAAQQGETVLTGVLVINLGDVAFDQGDLQEAKRRYQRAATIIKAIDPNRPVLTYIERRLGQVLFASGELAEAEALYKAALAKTPYPRTITGSEMHHALGELALRRGNLEDAELHHRSALSVREDIAPGSLWEAESCHALGTVAWQRAQREVALAFFRRAVGALESQVRNLGTSPEVRTRFRARHQAIYRDLERLLLELGRPQEAFHVVESSRARSLLALLQARELEFAAVPEPLERERRLADAEYDRTLARLGSVPSTDDAQLVRARQGLEVARQRQDEVRARIRNAAPRLAAMRDPQPLDLPGVRRALSPGTLLLTYSLGAEDSRVYAVGPGPEDFSVLHLDLGEVSLRQEVRSFREAIQTARGALGRRALLRHSERLGRALLSPAAGQLERAERVLVVPDAALHLLPFGALGLTKPKAGHRFLVQVKPIHVASSVTLYAELTRPEARRSAGGEVVGFGDPLYPRTYGAEGAPALRGALRSGLRLDPLPWTRGELSALRRVATKEPRLWLGSEATEQRAKSLDVDSRIVHFACHAFVDEAFPLESGLALSVPRSGQQAEENGLLQAWEVFEKVRLDAELVTLSACQTAVGKEVAGEGLLGLTWAFQYAGARSVLASLWEVSDASTADLMRRFYGHWGRGVPKAEALRRAQLELLERPATSAPFYWAAFELIGDWR